MTAKQLVRKPTERTTKPRATTHSMSASHKRALADGRRMSATVDRYLRALNTPKRRGRKVSKATLTARLVTAQSRAESATGVDRLLAAQRVRDLRVQIAATAAAEPKDVADLEAAFVRIAKTFSESRGVGYGAWRDAGVPTAVLRRAGITRARG